LKLFEHGCFISVFIYLYAFINSSDDEENIPETERIQMTVDKIKKGRKGDLLAEIQLIKDRHKQLDVLTQAKRRAEMENKKIRQSPKV